MAQQIQIRRDTAADWTSANPTLAAGEIGFEEDTGRHKIGDGTTAWNNKPYGPVTSVSTIATTTDTLALSDDKLMLNYTAAGAVTVTLANIAPGFECVLTSLGAGGLSVAAGGMSFANGFTPKLSISQGESLYIRQTAASTFVVIGGTDT